MLENFTRKEESSKKELQRRILQTYLEFRQSGSSDALPQTEADQKPWLDAWKKNYNPDQINPEAKRRALEILDDAIGAFIEHKLTSHHKNRNELAEFYGAIASATEHLRDYIQGKIRNENKDQLDYSLRLLQDTYDGFFDDNGRKKKLDTMEDQAHCLLERLKNVDIVKDPPSLADQYVLGVSTSLQKYYHQQSEVQNYQDYYMNNDASNSRAIEDIVVGDQPTKLTKEEVASVLRSCTASCNNYYLRFNQTQPEYHYFANFKQQMKDARYYCLAKKISSEYATQVYQTNIAWIKKEYSKYQTKTLDIYNNGNEASKDAIKSFMEFLQGKDVNGLPDDLPSE